MATENSGSKSSSTADSYIGSLISLTSKSEIRYEGVLYNINTEESSIGLRNVRSFGTEGRKKDGPPVLPSDKVYEYILFRGSDIKDLQVKSSPPVQSTPPINNDPAIIQSHYPRMVSTSSSLPSAVSGSLTDLSSHNAQVGLPGSNFQGGLPLYHPGGGLGSWGASPPPPSTNGSGLAIPMYWQGYYGPPPQNGLLPLHQQSLLRPPPGLSVPPSMQYSSFNAPLSTGASNVQGSNLPEAPSPLLPTTASSHSLTPSSLLPSASSSILSSPLPLVPSSSLALETLPSALPNRAPTAALPVVTPNTSLPSLSPLITSSSGLNTIIPPVSKPNAVSSQNLLYQSTSQPASSIVGISSSVHSETLIPSLVTPGQLLQFGSTVVPSSQPAPTAHKDVEVVQVSSSSTTAEQPAPITTEVQPPILPLPLPSRAGQKPNGAPFQTRHGYRGRERGRGAGSSRPVTKFTEEFDFTAMNEKFKKDEVWGHLGKSNKSHSKDKEGDGAASDEGYDDEDDVELSGIDVKPVYNKDDFFDSLSSNALDYDSQNGRTRFSEQMKIDTETFGEFSRYRGGRFARGPMRGGRSRGGYYGRSYGYGYGYGYGYARGRGRGMSGWTS